MLGLPDSVRVCLFDLDGVLTDTAKVHAADYDKYVDGKPRYDGVRSFLATRGIEIPEGKPDDPPSAIKADTPHRGIKHRP